jgi:hypothetical protein
MQGASSALKIAGNFGEAEAKRTQGKLQAIKLQTAAEAARVRAVQTGAAYQDDLARTLDTITAFRSAQNVSPDSPTGMALYDEAERRSDDARMTAMSNERIKALGYSGDALALQKASRSYTTAALLKSGPDFLNMLQNGKGAYDKAPDFLANLFK